MSKRARLGVVLTVAGAAVAVGYGIDSARADGIPTMETLAYSARPAEGGAPATTAHMIGVSLWSDASSTTTTFRECDTAATNITPTAGRFRVALDPSCVQAAHDNPDLWAQVTVDGTALTPRTHIAAVPYAVEADHVALTRANWIGVTPTTFPGSIVVGALSGYPAARAACASAFPGHPTAHMCTSAEIALNAQTGPDPFAAAATYAWYARAADTRLPTIASSDCSGFRSASVNDYGPIWVQGTNAPDLQACSTATNILCCD